MKKFTADFETATWLEDETYVWAWATCEIGNTKNLKIGKHVIKTTCNGLTYSNKIIVKK